MRMAAQRSNILRLPSHKHLQHRGIIVWDGQCLDIRCLGTQRRPL